MRVVIDGDMRLHRDVMLCTIQCLAPLVVQAPEGRKIHGGLGNMSQIVNSAVDAVCPARKRKEIR